MTTPHRTLLDLRGALSPGALRLAARRAELRGLDVDVDALFGDRTTSPLELEFLRLCRRHHLPVPEVNIWIDRYRVDFLWRAQRLVVETDGYRYHRGQLASAADRERDRRLERLGFLVLRFTYREVFDEPRRVAATVQRRLARNSR